jgi:hypothetical protein
MEYSDSTGTIELTKANTIFVKDQDGHNYAIHENDKDVFYRIMNEAYEQDDYYELEILFPNMIGMNPEKWRQQNLK